MPPWVIHFEVSTVIQLANQSVLPQVKGEVLALSVKARLDTK